MAPDIPVIDIGPFLAGLDASSAAAAIERAATEVGFFQVIGHGVPTALLDDVYDAARAFAALDVATKQRFRSPTGHPYRGVHLRPDASGTIRLERFLAARFDDARHAVAAGVDPQVADYYDPNCWPTQPIGFAGAVRALFERTQTLGGRLMELFSLALGLGDSAFAGLLEPNASSFAVNHYPAQPTATAPGSGLLFHEHADGNTLTILHQRGDYEGLQVSRLDAVDPWTPVPVREDAFVINMGKLMTRWTNDHWPATRHRVVASPDPAHQRTTLTTFHMPSLTATIAPLAALCGDDGPHYPPVTAYEADRASIGNYASARTDDLIVDPAVVAYASTVARPATRRGGTERPGDAAVRPS